MEEDKLQNKSRVNVELWNVKGKLVRNLLAILAVILSVVFIIYPFIFGNSDGIHANYFTIENQSVSTPVKNIEKKLSVKNDSNSIKNINRFLKEEIPLNYIDFHNNRRQFLTAKEKINYDKITKNLELIRGFIPEYLSYHTPPGYAPFENADHPSGRFLTVLYVENNGNKKIEKIEITISGGVNGFMGNFFEGDYVSSYLDTLSVFSNSKPILLEKLYPNEAYQYTIWSNYPIYYFNMNINYEGRGKKISPLILAATNTKIDSAVTTFVIKNKPIQFIIYITVPIGLFIIFKLIRRFYNFLFGVWRAL